VRVIGRASGRVRSGLFDMGDCNSLGSGGLSRKTGAASKPPQAGNLKGLEGFRHFGGLANFAARLNSQEATPHAKSR